MPSSSNTIQVTDTESTFDNHLTDLDQARDIWNQCSQRIRNEVSDTAWTTTFCFAQAISFELNSLTIAVPTQLHKKRIEQSFHSLVTQALTETVPGAQLLVEVGQDEQGSAETGTTDKHRSAPNPTDSASDAPAITGQTAGTHPAVPDIPPARTRSTRSTGTTSNFATQDTKAYVTMHHKAFQFHMPEDKILQGKPLSRFTFSKFISSTSNDFTHAAARLIAEEPNSRYNPLFIYSKVGLGKTHLLLAIAQAAVRKHPKGQVMLLTTERFLNEMVISMRTKQTDTFRAKYRQCNYLLLDDVQFMENRDGLQNEIFHTFNDMIDNGGQIVFASDRPPEKIAALEDRLRSRFRSGLMTDIQPPDFATRLAILQLEAEATGINISNPVLDFIAENITSSVRDLQGALNKVVAYTELTDKACTLTTAQDLLCDVIRLSAPATITLERVLEAATELFGVELDQLKGKTRSEPIVTLRHITMYVARMETDLSFPAIGREFGKDHSTILHAVSKIEEEMKKKSEAAAKVNKLRDYLRN